MNSNEVTCKTVENFEKDGHVKADISALQKPLSLEKFYYKPTVKMIAVTAEQFEHYKWWYKNTFTKFGGRFLIIKQGKIPYKHVCQHGVVT